MKRRDFGRSLALLAAGGTQLVLALEAHGELDTPTKITLDLSEPQYAVLLEVGGAVKVQVEGYSYPVIVVRLDEDNFAAYSSCCTHWGCEVELPDEEGVVYCFCHGSSFDRSGRLIDGAAIGDLPKVGLDVRSPTAVESDSWGQIKQRVAAKKN
jgi:Rieske Fe-S protein